MKVSHLIRIQDSIKSNLKIVTQNILIPTIWLNIQRHFTGKHSTWTDYEFSSARFHGGTFCRKVQKYQRLHRPPSGSQIESTGIVSQLNVLLNPFYKKKNIDDDNNRWCIVLSNFLTTKRYSMNDSNGLLNCH